MHIIFLEECVRSSCVGMMLSDAFKREYGDTLGAIRTDILAIEDGALFGEMGRSLYSCAGISAEDVISLCKK